MTIDHHNIGCQYQLISRQRSGFLPSHFTITVEQTEVDGTPRPVAPSTFAVTNHDDLFLILDKIRAGAILPTEETAEFTFGLKLFLEVLIRHRGDALFKDIWPHMVSFMKRLKAGLRDNNQ